jgi:hypothetical protein
MTQAELYQALESIGYPVAYGSFSSPVTPPFIIYQFAYSNDIMADNVNYVAIDDFQVELYTTKKGPCCRAKGARQNLKSWVCHIGNLKPISILKKCIKFYMKFNC